MSYSIGVVLILSYLPSKGDQTIHVPLSTIHNMELVSRDNDSFFRAMPKLSSWYMYMGPGNAWTYVSLVNMLSIATNIQIHRL